MKCRMHQMIKGVLITSLTLSSQLVFAVSDITNIGFKGNQDPSLLEISTNGEVTFEKQEIPQDKQVILELKGVRLPKQWSRKMDASQFNSKVKLISPYQVQGQDNTVRVVIQLNQSVPVNAIQEGNRILVTVPNEGAASASSNDEAEGSSGEDVAAVKVGSESESSAGSSTAKKSQSSSSNNSALDQYISSKGNKRFVGRPVTLNMRDVDVTDAFRLIAEASGFNIIVGDDVKGKITLSLQDVPWDQALDVILHTMRLGAERNNNILRIVTLANLTTEKQEELKAQQAAEASAPRVTRIFPISYANLSELQGILTKFASSPGLGGAAAIPGVPPVVVQADNRTNSLVVQDLPNNIEKMRKLIELLDTQTPQVLIEARVVEATEQFSKALSGNLGSGFVGPDSLNPAAAIQGSINGAGDLLGSTALASTPGSLTSGVATGSPPASADGGGIGFGFIKGNVRISALLNMQERESQVKVVSSPKTVVLNKERATIVQGTPVLMPPQQTVVNGVVQVTNQVQQANLSLDVKPTVTNEGAVLLDLNVTRDIPFPLGSSQQGIANRNIKTLVLVESGSTLVIGGVYTMTNTQSEGGLPFLRKIPIIGALFGREASSTDRGELFIFVTPRILNTKEAGITS